MDDERSPNRDPAPAGGASGVSRAFDACACRDSRIPSLVFVATASQDAVGWARPHARSETAARRSR